MRKAGLFKHAALVCGLFLSLLLTACGGGGPEDLLVGTWVSSNTNQMVIFEEDGSCVAPFTYNASWLESAERYTVQEDGTLVMTSETGHAGGSYERVDTEDEALDHRHNSYFLSGDTLIIGRAVYTKQ